MKKPAFLFAAALAGLTLTQNPLQTQAAQISVIQVGSSSDCSGVNTDKIKEYLANCQFGDSNSNDNTIGDMVETPDNESSGDISPDYHTYVLRVAELVNEARENAGLVPVTLQADVTAAAQIRAEETVTHFSHTRPDGRSCFTALDEAGVNYHGAGENIAWGQKTPEEVMNSWMNSSGHRANILNPNFTTIGVGYYQTSSGVNYWSQMFTY